MEAERAKLLADHEKQLADVKQQHAAQLSKAQQLEEQLVAATEANRLQQESIKQELEGQLAALKAEKAADAVKLQALEAEKTAAQEKSAALEAAHNELETKLAQSVQAGVVCIRNNSLLKKHRSWIRIWLLEHLTKKGKKFDKCTVVGIK
jgi:hypothetical protein